MTKLNPFLTRLWLLLGFVVIVGLWYLLKIALDVSIWRYSGPISLAIMLVLIFFYLRWRGHSFSWVGLVPLKSAKNWLLLLPQILLTVIVMGAVGAGHMYYQGLRGLIITGGGGVALGILFVLYKRNIWPLAIGHAAINSLSFTAMYLQLDI